MLQHHAIRILLIVGLLPLFGLSASVDPNMPPCVTALANTYFTANVIMFHTVLHSRNTTDDEYLSEMVKTLMKANKTVELFSEHNAPIPAENQTKAGDADALIVILLHPPLLDSDFTNLIHVIRNKRLLGPATKLLVVQKFTDYEMVERVLSRFWNELRAVSTVLMLVSRIPYQFFSINPYQPEWSAPRVINEWDGRFKLNDSLFPDKLPHKLSGLTIRATVSPQPPYVIARDGNGRYGGMDIRVFDTITESLGLSVEYVECTSLWPRLAIVDGKFQGLFGMLNHQEVDIVIAAMVLFADRYPTVAPLPPHYFDHMMWCAPRADNAPNWRSLYGAFTPVVWLFILFSMAGVVVVFYSEQRWREQGFLLPTVLYVAAMTIEQDAFASLRLGEMRSFLGLALLFFMIVTNCYKSGLVMLLTAPPAPHEINTLMEALDAGLVFFFIPPARATLNITDHELWDKVLQPGKHQFNGNLMGSLCTVAFNKTGIALSAESICDYFGFLHGFGKGVLFHYLPKKYFPFPSYMFMSPANPLQPLFSDKVLGLVEGGFPGLWMREFMYSVEISVVLHPSKNVTLTDVDTSGEPSAIKMEQTSIVFFLLLFCLLLCLVAFLTELSWDCLKKRRTALLQHLHKVTITKAGMNTYT